MLRRRHFLAELASTAFLCSIDRLSARPASPSRSLIPATPCKAPNYWCTWAVQNYMYGQGLDRVDPAVLEGKSGSKLAHNAMSEEALFGEHGWARHFHSRVREDLFLLLDDGWEAGGTATFELESSRFPSYHGTPAEKLSQLNNAAQSERWRGAALWCRNTPGGGEDARFEQWSNSAGIRYWKIDIGDPQFNLVRLRQEKRIPLTLEHVHGEGPLNGDWRNTGRFGAQPWGSRRIEILAHTDVYRTYDVTSILSLPTTLDRLAEMLEGAQGHPEIKALLNVEDEVYVAAAMGCTMGVMRHPLTGLRPAPDTDLFFNGPRQPKRRMDEVVRALRWQRIAAPFPAGTGTIRTSDEILTDDWTFRRGQTWESGIVGHRVRQGAPASMARNLDLPSVDAAGERPFVFCTRFPNGAVALAAQERTFSDRGWIMPKAEVTLDVGDAPGPFAIFGNLAGVTLRFSSSPKGKRILAQDLAADQPEDITHAVKTGDRSLRLPGSVISKIGLQAATPGDLSSPGMVLTVS